MPVPLPPPDAQNSRALARQEREVPTVEASPQQAQAKASRQVASDGGESARIFESVKHEGKEVDLG